MDVVINALQDVFKRRDQMKGLKLTYEGPIISLRHFTAKFEMIFINTLLIAFEESNVNSYIDTYFYKSMEQLASYPPLLLFPLLCIYVFFFILFAINIFSKPFNCFSPNICLSLPFQKALHNFINKLLNIITD